MIDDLKHYTIASNLERISLKVGLCSGTSSQQVLINLFKGSFWLPGKEGLSGIAELSIKKSYCDHLWSLNGSFPERIS